jgi:hypothetical protein
LIEFLCTHSEAAQPAAGVAVAGLLNMLGGIIAGIWATFGKIPIGGAFIAAAKAEPYVKLGSDLVAALASYSTLGGFLGVVLELLRDGKNLFPDGWVDDAIIKIAGAALASQAGPKLRRGPSNEILDTHDYALDHCYSGDSGEFFFDASKDSYVHFVDDVLKKAKSLGPIVGYISLRLCETTSKLGMQRFPLTVSIEVAISRPGSINKDYMKSVEDLALKHGDIPHWGQEQILNQANVEHLYAGRLEPWRWALAGLANTTIQLLYDGANWREVVRSDTP